VTHTTLGAGWPLAIEECAPELEADELDAEALVAVAAGAALDRAAGLRASSAIAVATIRHNPSPAIARTGQELNPWHDLSIMSPDYAHEKWAATGAVPRCVAHREQTRAQARRETARAA
jgi:hypothetical protein